MSVDGCNVAKSMVLYLFSLCLKQSSGMLLETIYQNKFYLLSLSRYFWIYCEQSFVGRKFIVS